MTEILLMFVQWHVNAWPEMLEEQADLLVEPRRPLIGDKLILKAIVLRHERQEALHLRRHVVLDKPELHTIPAGYGHLKGMNLYNLLYSVARHIVGGADGGMQRAPIMRHPVKRDNGMQQQHLLLT